MPRIWVLKCFLSHLNCLLLWNNCSCKHQKLLTFHSRFLETIPLHSFNIQVLILQTKLFCRRFGFTSRRNFLLINDVQVLFSLPIVPIHDEFFIPKFVNETSMGFEGRHHQGKHIIDGKLPVNGTCTYYKWFSSCWLVISRRELFFLMKQTWLFHHNFTWFTLY